MALKFFIIDDDSDDRELFAEALREIDPAIVCYFAADGQEAFEELSTEVLSRPDIIFLDINLPEMNGWDCLRRLKSTNEYSSIPVCMYSTSSNIMDKNLAIEMGAVCLVTKPDHYSRLKSILSIVISHLKNNQLELLKESL